MRSSSFSTILNHMVHFNDTHIDASFAALSDPTRRGVLAELARAEASISDLADRFDMTLTGIKKHVSILEEAGFVTTEKIGRVRTCRLSERDLEKEAAFIDWYRQLWSARFDALEGLAQDLEQQERNNDR